MNRTSYINCTDSSVGIVACLCFGKAKLHCAEATVSGARRARSRDWGLCAGGVAGGGLALSQTVLQGSLGRYFSHPSYKALL